MQSKRDHLTEFINNQRELSATIDLFGKKTCKAAQSIQRWGSGESDDIKSLTENLYGIFVKIEDAFEHHYKHGVDRGANAFYEIIDEVESMKNLSKRKEKNWKKIK